MFRKKTTLGRKENDRGTGKTGEEAMTTANSTFTTEAWRRVYRILCAILATFP